MPTIRRCCKGHFSPPPAQMETINSACNTLRFTVTTATIFLLLLAQYVFYVICWRLTELFQQSTKLALRKDTNGHVNVANLSSHQFSNMEEFHFLMKLVSPPFHYSLPDCNLGKPPSPVELRRLLQTDPPPARMQFSQSPCFKHPQGDYPSLTFLGCSAASNSLTLRGQNATSPSPLLQIVAQLRKRAWQNLCPSTRA
jgi:hypothetical protein